MENPMGHTHNADPANGKVCSHLVTDDMLASWGFVTEITAKIVGSKIVKREGIKWDAAVFAAWPSHVRICSPEPAVTPNWTPDPAHVADAIQWVAAHKRTAVVA
jgi:hypothetical protein